MKGLTKIILLIGYLISLIGINYWKSDLTVFYSIGFFMMVILLSEFLEDELNKFGKEI